MLLATESLERLHGGYAPNDRKLKNVVDELRAIGVSIDNWGRLKLGDDFKLVYCSRIIWSVRNGWKLAAFINNSCCQIYRADRSAEGLDLCLRLMVEVDCFSEKINPDHIYKTAIQCRDTVSGKVGDFIYNSTTYDPAIGFKAVSPVFEDLMHLFTWEQSSKKLLRIKGNIWKFTN